MRRQRTFANSEQQDRGSRRRSGGQGVDERDPPLLWSAPDEKMKSQITNALSDFFFEYETPRQVLVRNWKVGVVCRLIQLGVVAYIIG